MSKIKSLDELNKEGFFMTSKEQVELWVKGESVHRTAPFYEVGEEDSVVVLMYPSTAGGECCPDFSCCEPHLKWDEKIRIAFFEAFNSGNRKLVDSMLMGALGSLLANEKLPKTHLVGQNPEVLH